MVIPPFLPREEKNPMAKGDSNKLSVKHLLLFFDAILGPQKIMMCLIQDTERFEPFWLFD